MSESLLVRSKAVNNESHFEFKAMPTPSGVCLVALTIDASGVRRVGSFALEMSALEALELAREITELVSAAVEA
jgi:hypothetical protein